MDTDIYVMAEAGRRCSTVTSFFKPFHGRDNSRVVVLRSSKRCVLEIGSPIPSRVLSTFRNSFHSQVRTERDKKFHGILEKKEENFVKQCVSAYTYIRNVEHIDT